MRKGIAVIGPGNWGSSLIAGIVRSEIPLLEVVGREGSAASVREAGEMPVRSLGDAVLDAEVLWICVPDDRVAEVAARVAARRSDLGGQVVVHSSGALTAESLEAARRAGAEVGGIAPVFSFPTREPVSLRGVLFAVECADRGDLWDRLSGLVGSLGGEPVQIGTEAKVFYHAAATMASPLMVSALNAAVETAKLSGMEERAAKRVVEALAATTMRNYFERGAAGSFSGAFARGDTGTVKLHLEALGAHPMLHGVYEALARNAVASLPVKDEGRWGEILDRDGAAQRGVHVRD